MEKQFEEVFYKEAGGAEEHSALLFGHEPALREGIELHDPSRAIKMRWFRLREVDDAIRLLFGREQLSV